MTDQSDSTGERDVNYAELGCGEKHPFSVDLADQKARGNGIVDLCAGFRVAPELLDSFLGLDREMAATFGAQIRKAMAAPASRADLIALLAPGYPLTPDEDGLTPMLIRILQTVRSAGYKEEAAWLSQQIIRLLDEENERFLENAWRRFASDHKPAFVDRLMPVSFPMDPEPVVRRLMRDAGIASTPAIEEIVAGNKGSPREIMSQIRAIAAREQANTT
jgi:hypothetical protein